MAGEGQDAKTGKERSPGPLKDLLQAALLHADYENYKDSENSEVAGEGQDAKIAKERSPGPLKDQAALLYAGIGSRSLV